MPNLTEKECQYLNIESKNTENVRVSHGLMRWLGESYSEENLKEPPAFPHNENRFKLTVEQNLDKNERL